MSIEHKDNQEKSHEFVSKQESFSDLQKNTQQEIHTTTKEFIDQDNQIQEIVNSANLKNPEMVQTIVAETHIKETFVDLNLRAKELERESLKSIQKENVHQLDKKLKEIWSKNKNSEIPGDVLQLRLAELESFRAKGKLSLLDQQGWESEFNLSQEFKKEDKEILKKEFTKIKDRVVQSLSILQEHFDVYGIDFETLDSLEHTMDPEEEKMKEEINVLFEELNLVGDLNSLADKKSPYVEFLLQALDEIKNPFIKKGIFERAIENKNTEVQLLVDTYISKISEIDTTEAKELFVSLRERIKEEKDLAMQDFSGKEILAMWNNNPDIQIGRDQLKPHIKKIEQYLQELDSNHLYEEILLAQESLDFLTVSSGYKTPKFSDIAPKWMSSLIRQGNSESISSYLKKDGVLKDEIFIIGPFDKEMYIQRVLPLGLLPDSLSETDKISYAKKVLESKDLSFCHIMEYSDFLGIPIESLIEEYPNLAESMLLFEDKNITKDILEKAVRHVLPSIFVTLVFKEKIASARLLNLSGANEKIEKSIIHSSNAASTILFHADIEAKKQFLDTALQCTRDDEFAVNVSSYADAEYLMSLPGAKEKVQNTFQMFLEKGMYDASKNLISNPRFSFLREGYADDVSVHDILFEKLISASRLHAKEDQEQQIKETRLKNIQESFWVTNNSEKLPTPILATLEKFENQYGDKGKHLIALAITAYGTKNPDGFARRMHAFENILNQYDPETVPDGCKVSMGIEYEVTKPIADTYGEESFLGYKKDIQLVSESANIATGKDAIHEIALRPNYNPYMLMAEVKLLQDAGFLDLNFKHYKDAPRGYHLSLVGDNGLHVNENMHFLNNLLTMTQLSGVIAGKKIENTKNIYSKSFENFTDHVQFGERCEIKGMATDSVEQFEKSIMTSHYAGIAIQLCDKYLGREAVLFSETGNNPQEFEKMLMNTGSLLQPFASDQERDIVYAWMKLKRDTVDAVGQHNNSFGDSEFHGYILTPEGEYIDTAEHIDVVRNKKLIEGRDIESDEFKQSIMISNDALFSSQSSDFVNALTAVNNIFLKPPQGDENSPVNAKSVLDTKKHVGYGGVMENRVEDSLFDNQKRLGDGYYYVQGASEEMIIHKSQILLNEFYNQMQGLLQSKGREREKDRRSQEWLEYNAQ